MKIKITTDGQGRKCAKTKGGRFAYQSPVGWIRRSMHGWGMWEEVHEYDLITEPEETGDGRRVYGHCPPPEQSEGLI